MQASNEQLSLLRKEIADNIGQILGRVEAETGKKKIYENRDTIDIWGITSNNNFVKTISETEEFPAVVS